jgi:integrase
MRIDHGQSIKLGGSAGTGACVRIVNLTLPTPRYKRVHAHGLRHTHAFELATEGTPLHIIQAQLGHASVATTDRYIRHLNPAAVVEAMKSRVWTCSGPTRQPL